jgi:hypothetical protein
MKQQSNRPAIVRVEEGKVRAMVNQDPAPRKMSIVALTTSGTFGVAPLPGE